MIEETDADIVLNGISGFDGLPASVYTLECGKNLALANKESVVCGWSFLFDLAQKNNASIIPVDSEHSAIFQLLKSHGQDEVEKLVITASGGPFRTWTEQQLNHATAKDALCHPTWKMGKKITIDSATLANKGMEVIEASKLFGFPPEKIEVVVHPQSIVHSMIRMRNGAVYAQLGMPDMSLPIISALLPDTGVPLVSPLSFDDLALTFQNRTSCGSLCWGSPTKRFVTAVHPPLRSTHPTRSPSRRSSADTSDSPISTTSSRGPSPVRTEMPHRIFPRRSR